MDASESERLFKRADRLYQEGRYNEALEVLDKLDIAFPDTKNILMPRAMCLVHLGQVDQGRAIYEYLAARHPAERLKKLRNLLKHTEAQAAVAAVAAPIDALDAVLNINAAALEDVRITATPQAVKDARQAATAERAAPAAQGPNWAKWAVIGGGALVVVALLSLPLFVQSDGQSTARERPPMTEISAENMDDLSEAEVIRFLMVIVLVILPLSLLSIPPPIFLTLHFFGELPKDSMLLSYLVLLGYMVLIYTICGLVFSCLGLFLGVFAGLGYIIAVLMSVNKIFELGLPRTLIFAGFTIGVGFIQGPVFSVILRMFSFEVPMW